MYNTAAVESLNKPAIVLCNEDFVADARSATSGRGMPGLRLVSETVPCESTVMADIESGLNEAMDNIVAALTQPLTDEEKSPKPKEVEKLPHLVFKGNLQEINQFFYRRGWTDGLPIIPPTEEAVEEMLMGTDLPADHVVTKIVPRLGKATVGKIAINAVMAGALPTYMPLLIAGVQALMEPAGRFGIYEVSTGSWSPFWVVNGPVRNDLNINSGSGALSPGDIANAAIGRAIGLIIKNIGGARKGIEDMGVHGNPGKYTMVIAENEEKNPWEPIHVERGFNKEDSTITVSYPNGSLQFMSEGHEPKELLNTIIYNLPPAPAARLWVLLNPALAKILADNGWTKQEVKRFIVNHARCPLYKYPRVFGALQPKTHIPWNDMDSVALYDSPEDIMVSVSGGPGNIIALLTSGLVDYRGPSFPNPFVTKRVELPANWERLVEKYKNIVPTYMLGVE